MIYVRIGNDITTEWTILTQGQPVSLLGRDIHVYLTNVSGTVLQELAPVTDYLIGGEHDNVLTILFPGSRQKELGTFGYTIAENPGKEGMKTLDSGSAFTLVGQTSNSDYATLGAFRSELTGDLINGLNGLSAFQIWQRHGHEGETEEQFLESLIGPPGPQGPPGPPGELTPEQIEGIRRGGRAYAMSVGQGVWLSTERTLDASLPTIPVELRRMHFIVGVRPLLASEWLLTLQGENTVEEGAELLLRIHSGSATQVFVTEAAPGDLARQVLLNLYYDSLSGGSPVTLDFGGSLTAFLVNNGASLLLRLNGLAANTQLDTAGSTTDLLTSVTCTIPADETLHDRWMYDGPSLSDGDWLDTGNWTYVSDNMNWNN